MRPWFVLVGLGACNVCGMALGDDVPANPSSVYSNRLDFSRLPNTQRGNFESSDEPFSGPTLTTPTFPGHTLDVSMRRTQLRWSDKHMYGLNIQTHDCGQLFQLILAIRTQAGSHDKIFMGRLGMDVVLRTTRQTIYIRAEHVLCRCMLSRCGRCYKKLRWRTNNN